VERVNASPPPMRHRRNCEGNTDPSLITDTKSVAGITVFRCSACGAVAVTRLNTPTRSQRRINGDAVTPATTTRKARR